MVVAQTAYSDVVKIPFGVYVDEMKQDSKDLGLDLEGKRDSDGFVRDMGMNIEVCSYRPFTIEELYIIKDVSLKNAR